MVQRNELPELAAALTRVIDKSPQLQRRIANMAVARIGARSVKDFMQQGPRARRPGEKGPLIMQSQRLARAVMGGRGSRKRISATNNLVRLIWEIFVPYAAIHEYGGTTRLPITAQMRRFFWAQWYETGDDKWKAMALSKKAAFSINMPPRPYLSPAVDAELPDVQTRAAELAVQFVDAVLRS